MPRGIEAHCNSWEVDQGRFMSLEEGRHLIHPDQAAFLDRLIDALQQENR